MPDHPRRIISLAAVLLAALCLSAGAALAARSEGWVTRGDLDRTAADILDRTEQTAAAYEQELTDRLAALIAGYTARMDALVGEEAAGGQYAAVYTLVTLTRGQTLDLAAGGEVVLRTGEARCVSRTDPGLIDTTAGDILPDGGALTPNHLYLSAAEGRSVTAAQQTAALLVRGGYTIR